MTDTHIDYDKKVQDALRQVVRSVLTEAARDGLKGTHHFYIAFKTQADGVSVPSHLMQRFPDEMTIVLQHKFWGLKVLEDRFEVGLSFNQKPEHLVIPFEAIVGFVDPSVQFALQFHDDGSVNGEEGEGIDGTAADLQDAPGSGVHDAFFQAQPDTDEPQDRDAAPDEEPDNAITEPEAGSKPDGNGDGSDDDTGGNNVVALDAFRKK
ncbi:SspB family protein [Eilatimonas milleporae]|uniref:Stringent starvation protein B n=1 Tax=Eilatimonas milleporae TaxID=911205 RepID=A0A3M0CQI7_9PROT|nr:ClpXP protease specificity-enhancing factor SspB [Eilatimonas milleporae]RMB11752.1 hypothetical protein BXY39_0235 [Eilatimonas milleporae]